MQDVRVAAAQIESQPCKPEQNLDRIERMVDRAGRRKVQMMCFPEMAVSGFDYEKRLRAIYDRSEPVPDGPSTQRLIDLARARDMILLAGISEKGDGELRHNTCVIVGPDGYIGKYRKVHMNSERWLYCESSTFPVFDTPFGRIGVSICFDNTFCECARILAIKGAEILFAPHCYGALANPAGKPLSRQVRQWRDQNPMKFLQARANDNKLFAVFSNMFGGRHNYIGASCVLGPRGDLLVAFDRWEEGMAVADLKASDLSDARAAQTYALKRRRPSIYSDIVRLS